MKRLLLALSAVAVIAATTATADSYPRQPGVDAVHYAFDVSLRDDTDEIEAEATVELAFVKAGQGSFALDLASPSGGRGMTVTGVAVDGTFLPFSHRSNRLEVTLPSPPPPGERRTVTVRYRGEPTAGLRIGLNRYGERTFFSNNWPDKAHYWLPVIDHPYDKATTEFIVTAPSRYQVVSNGVLVEETDLGDGRRQTHWKQSVPIAAWLNALGVARFTSHHAGTVRSVPLQTWVHPRDRRAGLEALEGPSRRALDFFIERIGPFPYEKLGGVQAAGTSGGMEHASAIFFGEDTVDRGPATRLVAHEVAHQWFGDSVTERDWDDIWLSEGFATYFALLFIEHEEGRESFVAGLRRSRAIVFAAEARDPRLTVVHANLPDTSLILNDLVYQKGGWVLHMLRGSIGTDAFTSGIRTYYATYRDGSVTTDDFRRVMEEAANADLSWFFRQWLNRPGHPVIEASWGYDPAAKSVVIDLAQTQPGDPYRLPLGLGLSFDGTPATARTGHVEMVRRRQQFRIRVDGEPSRVVLDPDTWLLMESRVSRRPM
jgi:aminopeptidase N